MSAQASRHPTTVLNSFSAAARAGLVQKRSASHPTINSIAVRAAYMPATSQFHPQNSQIHDTPASVKTLHLQTKSATSRRITCAQRYKISSLLAGSAVSQQALAEARQQAREQGLTEKEINEISVSRWADSSKEKIILHGIAGLIQAKVGGTSALAGAASAVLNEAFTSIVNDYIADKLPAPKRSNYAAGAEGDKAFEADTKTNTQDRKALGEISAALLGATGSALAGQGRAGIAAGAGIAVTADQNNRQLHPDERKKAAELAAKSGGKYTPEQIEEQMRLMGNSHLSVQPNTTDAATTPEQNAQRIANDPSMPVAVQGNVITEVPGQYNRDIQQYIISNTTQGTGYIPGQSPYVASNPLAGASGSYPSGQGTAPRNLPTVRCGNNDLDCKAGVNTQRQPLPDGTYGAGMYTPVIGGELEVELKDGKVVGGKGGIGVGAGGHMNLGTRNVSGGILQGPVGGYKSPSLIDEPDEQGPGTVRVGPSLTIGAGIGAVGVEGSISRGFENNGVQNRVYNNRSVNATISPAVPVKIGAEIKLNIIEFQVKPPVQQGERK